MSQYGAQGAAIAGKSVKQILDFYYPGTTTGKATGSIRVRVTADTTDGVRVGTVDQPEGARSQGRQGLHVAQGIDPEPVVDRPERRARHEGQLVRRQDPEAWTLWKTFNGMAQFEGAAVIGLILPSGAVGGIAALSGRSDIVGRASGHGERRVTGVLPARRRTAGGLVQLASGGAAGAGCCRAHLFGLPPEAGRRGRAYDLCDTTSCQVYGGYDSEKRRRTPRSPRRPGRSGCTRASRSSRSSPRRTVGRRRPAMCRTR